MEVTAPAFVQQVFDRAANGMLAGHHALIVFSTLAMVTILAGEFPSFMQGPYTQKVYEWGYESRLLLDKVVKDQVPESPLVKADLVRVTKENTTEYGKSWGKWLGESSEAK